MASRTALLGIIIFAPFVLGACGDARTHDARGRIVGFGDDGRTIIVQHEEIPGLMPAMTMPFTARDTSGFSRLEVRDAISFSLTISNDSSWIDDIELLPDTAVAMYPAGTQDDAYRGGRTPRVLEVGDRVPQFELLTHADTTLQLKDLAGKAVLLTFIYTRCPLPEYCPLMSQNFARLQPLLERRYGDQVQLLSVSFDPRNDTPSVLRQYAARYTDDLSSWTFATGDSVEVKRLAESFGEYYAPMSSEIVHNLVTVLIGPNGRIKEYWRGNDWTPEEIPGTLEGMDL